MREATVDLPHVDGWDVISADAVRVGRVVEVDREGFLVVELVPTLRGGADLPGRPTPGERLPGDLPNTRLTDPDPTVGETELYGHQNAGAMKHASDLGAAVPRDSSRDRAVDEEAPRRVRIPARLAQAREGESQVFLGSLRSQEVAALPSGSAPDTE